MLEASHGSQIKDAWIEQWEQEYEQSFHMPPYTQDEQVIIDKETEIGTTDRLINIIQCIEINMHRYQQIAFEQTDPAMRAHFERLRAVGMSSIFGYLKVYESEYGVTLPGTIISYDGTEGVSHLPKRHANTTATERIELPA